MTDPVWIISSSALILAVILIRAAFGRRMKAWMRCALWALVLVRLLVPGTLLSAPVSLESAANRVQAVRDLEAVRDVTSITHTESGAVVGAVRRPKEASPGAAEAGHTAPAATVSPAAPDERNTAVILESATPERFDQGYFAHCLVRGHGGIRAVVRGGQYPLLHLPPQKKGAHFRRMVLPRVLG